MKRVKGGVKMEDEKDSEKKSSLLSTIRAELNLEKWPLWQPTHSRSSQKARVLEREVALPNGSRIKAKVEIVHSAKYGPLTTDDQRNYYGLIRNWEEEGRPTGQTPLSLRGLTRILDKKWGTNVIESLSESLKRMRSVTFFWTNSYYNSLTKETMEVMESFNILSDLKIVSRKRDGVVNQSKSYYRFNDFIVNNLLGNYTKPLLLNVVVGFKSEIVQLLYIYLDLILAGKYRYERRLKELFDDLGLRGKDYHKPSVRKRILETIIAELIGVRISTGFIISAAIERTKDGKDYKVVFQKGDTLPEALSEVASGARNSEQPESSNAPEMSEEEAEARLNALSDEERQALRDRVTAKVLEEHPILKENSYSNILGRIISRRMQEEMK